MINENEKTLNIKFSGDIYSTLLKLQESLYNIPFTEVIRRAISVFNFMVTEIKSGSDVLVRNPKTKEVTKIKLI